MEISEIEENLKEKRMLNESVNDSTEYKQTIPIPEYKIGWIIGKNGSYINQVILNYFSYQNN